MKNISRQISSSQHNTLIDFYNFIERVAEEDPTWWCAYRDGDADEDFVPNDRDQCPDTPSMTAVYENGCTNPNMVHGPDEDVWEAITEHNDVMYSPNCVGASFPSTPIILPTYVFPFACRYQVFDLDPDCCPGASDWPECHPFELNLFVGLLRPNNQPDDCELWYQVQAYLVLSDGTQETFEVVFFEDEATPYSIAPFDIPGAIQFSMTADSPGDRGRWASYPPFFVGNEYGLLGLPDWSCLDAHPDFNVRIIKTLFRVRAINGMGMRSPWTSLHRSCLWAI